MTATEAVRQATTTAEEYFLKAVAKIDKEFGEGYSKDNPLLVATFMKVSAMDFNTWAQTEKDKL